MVSCMSKLFGVAILSSMVMVCPGMGATVSIPVELLL